MSKRPEQEVYEFEGFRLDAAHTMLYRNGAEISLPPKAVETLLALVQRRGEILSKDELMETIWTDSIVEESNLSQYLHLLRKVLGETRDGKPFIETLRRRGYRFVADVSAAEATANEIPNTRLPAGWDRPQDDELIIGREREAAEIIRLITNEKTRLLTLTGVGGVGKTTLAQSIGRRLRDDFSDGVFFVELAAVRNAEVVASAIASLTGVKEATGKTIFQMLKQHLSERSTLLILDNFEQVISAAPYISELLANSANLKILITSRVLLHLSVEREFVVPPLELPSAKSGDLLQISGCEAVQLFVVRARSIKPTFALTDENAGSVAAICSRLDGLPLAIELAAARIKIMSPAAILERLESQLLLLTGGARDLPARQQTMRGTVGWSYDLLQDDEKALFRRLSVFAGSFTMEAAEAVVSEDEDLKEKVTKNSQGTAVLDGVASLGDKSLLVAKEQNGVVRFRMLEVVREYALEALEASGERDEMSRRHAGYFLALGEKAEPQLQAAQSAEWLNRLEDEHDNLRAALGWFLTNDTALGQRLAGSIWRFWWLHGHVREGCEQLGVFLSQADQGDLESRTKMLLAAGFLNRLRGASELAHSYSAAGRKLANETGDPESGAVALHQLGFLALDGGDLAQAGQMFEEGLLLAKDSGNKQILGLLLNGLGEMSRLQEDYGRAADFYRQALAFNREAGDLVRQTTNLINLGATALSQGEMEAAGSFYRDGLKISSKMADMNGTLYCLEGIAGAYWSVRKPGRAALLLGAAEASREANNLFIETADREPYDRSVALVRDSLGETIFADIFAKGRKLDLEEAVDLALIDTLEAETEGKGQFSSKPGGAEIIQTINVE
ncbi:MAG: helix-turn-helix transcriptional regulator [Saprospiraceae bacterium]|nr:helix-turn-helix transcriptional regulator [Pyrinomonadaceae bacterium]